MTRTSRRIGLLILIGLLAVTAGCSGDGGTQLAGGDSGQAGTELDSTGGDASAQATVSGRSQGKSATQFVQIRQRAVIKTGLVQVQVRDFDAARRNLTRGVKDYGGYVSDSRVEVDQVDNTSFKSGMIILRVPSENFSELMAYAKSIGEVESARTNSTDVTDQLVDINARLKNLRAERERLRQLYRTANDTEAILAVEQRLSEVQGQIERLSARKKQLRRNVALSTLRVELHEPRPDTGPMDATQWYDVPILTALLESVNGVVITLRVVVVAAAYALPYVVVFTPPIIGAAYALRRSRSLSAKLPFWET